MTSPHVRRLALLAAAVALLAACASEVRRDHAEMQRVPAPSAHHYILTTAVGFRLDTGYSRMLGGGTELLEVGETDHGAVLRPLNTVLTVEGANVHEAWLVVREQRVVGFYLPVEQAFSPLPNPTSVSLEERPR